MSQEMYVAVSDGEVHGGVWLHEHAFYHRGKLVQAGWLKYPVAESLINRDYGGVPGAMIVTLMRRQARLMALGMGHRHTPFAQLLDALGWTIIDVPFFAAPVRPALLLRHLPPPLRSGIVDAAGKAAAFSGLATLAAAPLNLLRYARTRHLLRGISVQPVPEFGEWADNIWAECRSRYGFIARRDSAMLNQFYPASFPRLSRLRVRRDRRDIGWICTTLADPSSEGALREFGQLRVGLLADSLGQPQDAPAILAAGIASLVRQGADVVVTNQLHPSWSLPLRFLGFLPRASNFLFACSKPMAERLSNELASRDLFLNRGDCDGPPRWS